MPARALRLDWLADASGILGHWRGAIKAGCAKPPHRRPRLAPSAIILFKHVQKPRSSTYSREALVRELMAMQAQTPKTRPRINADKHG
jgi:hypothetical protein